MKGTLNPVVKICCISSNNEALTAIAAGATALGLVSSMPSGPGVISDDMIIEIVKVIPFSVDSFLLTSRISSDEIIKQLEKIKTNTVQIVDEVNIEVYEVLKKRLPDVKIVQVVHVIDNNSVDYALRVSEFVDAILLDSGNPNLKIKELGGTGKVHDWNLSREIRERVDIAVYLAGGLNPGNVQRAIREVEPYGVDLCSGVRTNGVLDKDKLTKFFKAVRTVSI